MRCGRPRNRPYRQENRCNCGKCVQATLAAAAYDADGRLKQTVFYAFTGSVEKTYAELGLDVSEAGTVKAYLFDETVSKVKPLCEAASVALNA